MAATIPFIPNGTSKWMSYLVDILIKFYGEKKLYRPFCNFSNFTFRKGIRYAAGRLHASNEETVRLGLHFQRQHCQHVYKPISNFKNIFKWFYVVKLHMLLLDCSK